MEHPDCLYAREVKRLLRSFKYIQKKNFDQRNGKCTETSAFQLIRDKCEKEIEHLMFALHVRRR